MCWCVDGGQNTALLMQNSGLGNSVNALASLDFLYGIPLLMIISHRGCEGELIVGQMPMGRLDASLLKLEWNPTISASPAEAGSVGGPGMGGGRRERKNR